MILLVGSLAFQDNIARKPVLHYKAEFRFIDHVLLWTEVHQKLMRQELLLVVVDGHWWHTQSCWDVPQWK